MRNPKVLLLTPPVIYARQMPIAAGYLSAYMKSKGYETEAWDLNADLGIASDGNDYFWSQFGHCRDFYRKNREIFDRMVDRIMEYNPDILGFMIWTTSHYFSLKLALAVKRRNPSVTIVFGGYLCSCTGAEIFNYPQVDVVVQGEGEETLFEIAEQLRLTGTVSGVPGCIVRKDGALVRGGPRPEITDLDSLPFPDFSGFDPTKYLYKNHIPILFNRGCAWRCGFCTMVHSWKKCRSRSADNIYREMQLRKEQYSDLAEFEVCDAAVNQNVPLLMELCDRLIADGNRTPLSGMAQIRPEMTRDMIFKARAAGFRLFNFGMESGSPAVLKRMGKHYTIEQAEIVVRDTFESGMDVIMNFVVGFPGETEEDFCQTLEFIKRNSRYIHNIAPGHECDINMTPIAAAPGRYDVVVPLAKPYSHLWHTVDGANTFDERVRRKNRFDELLKTLEIPIRCGHNDRVFEKKYAAEHPAPENHG